MTRYDAVVIGAGLGGLTAAAILARQGRKVLVVERGNSVGGAASSYKAGDLFIEASLHKTSAPQHPCDAKHRALSRAGVLDKIEWVPTGPLHEVRGGPLREPFTLPNGFDAARDALTARFPEMREGIVTILDEMAALAASDGTAEGFRAALSDQRLLRMSLSERLTAAFGSHEAIKCALAGNLWFFHDNPDALWWPVFASGQGQFLQSGGVYVKTGSQRLSSALARAVRGAGGDVQLRRVVVGIGIGASGRVSTVAHEAKAGGDRLEVETGCIISNAAPGVAAALLPDATGARLKSAYAGYQPSISLFALTLGLSRPPQEVGLDHYSTQLLPEWMTTLAAYADGTALFAGEPAGRMPPMSIVSYAAIDSGVPTSPYIVSVVGADRLSNWRGMERPAYVAKRARWQQAILGALDLTYPGLSAAVTASSFNTASSMVSYLNQPDGCAYGFAPVPPRAEEALPMRSPRTVVDGLYIASAYGGYGGYNGAIQAGEACADAIVADA